MSLNADRERLKLVINNAEALLQFAPLSVRVAVLSIVQPLIELLKSMVERLEQLEKERQP